MGQRSQLYIRCRNKKTLVAMHLQWNWGEYMINRGYQLLDYIQKEASGDYSFFRREDGLSYDKEEAINSLHALIQMNLTVGSYVGGHDLVKEARQWGDYTTGETFKIDPERQDNNNGILVIDVLEDGTIKYGFSGGGEETGDYDHFNMVTAAEYFNLGQKQCREEQYLLKNRCKEMYDKVQEQIKFIDDNFKLLTNEEYKDIFNTSYEYKNCMEVDQ